MGYDFHITRKEHWASLDHPLITPEEWLAVVAADSELKLYDDSDGPYFVEWNGSIETPEQWLDLDVGTGSIFTKYPDDALVEKMLQIAKVLGAKVQGDGGEVYLSGSEVV